MKKTSLGLTLATLFIAGVVQAEDHSATVDITGSVVGDYTECTVSTTATSINLSDKIDSLPAQGQNATSPTWFVYSINGCDGKIALQLQGITDDADGTTLANRDISETAAKGVGIGLFDKENAPLKLNDSLITPNEESAGKINLQLVKLNGQIPVEGTVHGSLTLDIVHL